MTQWRSGSSSTVGKTQWHVSGGDSLGLPELCEGSCSKPPTPQAYSTINTPTSQPYSRHRASGDGGMAREGLLKDAPESSSAASQALSSSSRTKLAELSPSNFRDAYALDPDDISTRAEAKAESPPIVSSISLEPAAVQERCTRGGTASPRTPTPVLRSPWAQRGIEFRDIRATDLDGLRDLHEQIFPIQYEMEFFLCVVQHRGVLSWGACDATNPDHLIGFVTARIMEPIEVESTHILPPSCMASQRTLMYILTLGVEKRYRKSGIASELVRRVVEHARRTPWCEGVFLHVVAYNHPAIRFYSRLDFTCLRRAPSFYVLEGHLYDAYVFVHYVNGGQAHSASLRDSLLSSSIGLLRGWEYICSFMSGRPPRATFHSMSWSSLSSFFKCIFSFFLRGSASLSQPLSPPGNKDDAMQLAIFLDSGTSNKK